MMKSLIFDLTFIVMSRFNDIQTQFDTQIYVTTLLIIFYFSNTFNILQHMINNMQMQFVFPYFVCNYQSAFHSIKKFLGQYNIIACIMDELMNPYEIQQKNNHYHKTTKRKQRSQSFGAIFRLPRPVLSSEHQAITKTIEIENKQSQPKLNISQSDFINEYRDNLRRTIFTQTKQMFKNNKKMMQKLSQPSFQEYKKTIIQQTKNKSQPKEIKKSFSLYQTIICSNPHGKKKQEHLQLKVNRLPIIEKIDKKKRKKMQEFFQNQINSYQTNSPSRTNHIQYYGETPLIRIKPKKAQKSQIMPWQTVQELGF